MAKIYYQQDCDLNVLKGKTVAIIGLPEQMNDAHTAVSMLISGSEHTSVFSYLDRKRKEAKMDMMSYYY